MSQEEQPVINIRGEKVALGPHRRDLLPLYERWINDFQVTRTLAVPMRPMTREAEEDWYRRTSTGGAFLFTIYALHSLQPIGNTGLHDVDHFHRTAEFGILIGEKEFWGQGLGTETARLMLEYGFTILGLKNIMLTVYGYNQRGIGAYTRAGFREFGRRREARFFGGKTYDIIYMDCLAEEFQGGALLHLMPPGI